MLAPTVKYHYSDSCFAHRMKWGRQSPGPPVQGLPREIRDFSGSRGKRGSPRDPELRDIGQMGSLAGAAYLLNSNAGVLRHTQ